MTRYKKTDPHSFTLGTTITFELLKAKPHTAQKVFFHSKLAQNAAYEELVKLCERHHIPTEKNDKVFSVLSAKENCFAIGMFTKYQDPLQKWQNHIVLDRPSNMGNLGTIIRTAAGFGMGGIALIKPAADLFDPKVVRASMGAVFRTPFAYFESFEDYLAFAGSENIYLFMLDGATPLPEVTPAAPFSLVFGNEAAGLPAHYKKYGTPVVIPHSAAIDSLNLDNAVSIGLYEFTKSSFTK